MHFAAKSILACILLLDIAPCLLFGQSDIKELAELQAWYRQEQGRIDDNYLASMVAIEGDYAKQLKDLEKSLTSKGDLEGILAVRKEKERFTQAKSLTADAIVSTPAELQTVQMKNISQPAALKTAKNMATEKLICSYLEKLEILKKNLTQNLKIAEAVKVKEEITRISGKTISNAGGTGNGAGSPSTDIRYEIVECIACRGAGRNGEDCARCKGCGKCTSCDGIGRKPSAMRDSRKSKNETLVICTVCRGTGKCQACKGSGHSDNFTDCAVCSGSGKTRKAVRIVAVPSPVLPVTSNASSNMLSHENVSPQTTNEPAPAATSSTSGKQLEEYATTVKTLRSDFEKGTAREVEFDSISTSQDKHTGSLLKSTVYLVEATPRRITIGTSREDIIRGGTAMRADSIEAGKKAVDLFWSLKRDDRVVVTYGIIGANNIIFFNVEK